MDGLRQQAPAETIESGRADDNFLTTGCNRSRSTATTADRKKADGTTTPTNLPAFPKCIQQEIEAAKARLEALYAEEQPRYALDSVLNNGPDYRACVEFLAGQSEMLAKSSYQLTQSIAL